MTKAIELPADLKGKFELTQPLFGGPVFDFPAQNMKGVDMSKLTEQQATRLIARGYKGLRAVVAKANPTPTATEKNS